MDEEFTSLAVNYRKLISSLTVSPSKNLISVFLGICLAKKELFVSSFTSASELAWKPIGPYILFY